MTITTEVGCDVRAIMQFNEEENTWMYFLNGVEISMEQWQTLKLPIQQPDQPE